jgi:glycosyltransferase involved in cell wall biosynthesis
MLTGEMELAVVMPVYNEEATIETVLNEWMAEFSRLGISFSIMAVNDGSRDGTGAVLQRMAERFPAQVVAIDKTNAGHGRACRAGYNRAVQMNAAWTLQIDSDGQCDPRFFAEFWQGRDGADCIFGLRTSRDDGAMRSLVSGLCRLATSALSGVDLKDANVPYRLMRTPALAQALTGIPEDFDMQNVALTATLKRDRSLRWKHVPIHFRDRQGGTNSINLRRIVSMGWQMLRSFHRIRR